MVFDKKWISQFSNIPYTSPISAYNIFKLDSNKQFKKFINGQITAPSFSYSQIDIDALDRQIYQLRDLYKEIKTDENNIVIKQIYLAKIKETIWINQLIKSTAIANWRKFKSLNNLLYGECQQNILTDALFRYYKKLRTRKKSLKHSYIIKAYQKLISLLPEKTQYKEYYTLPSKRIFKKYKDLADKDTPAWLKELLDNPVINAGEIVMYFEKTLKSLNYKSWKVLVDENLGKKTISIDQSKQQIIIPSQKQITLFRFKQLVVHEIMTHIRRSVNGKSSKLKLLGIGFEPVHSWRGGYSYFQGTIVKG